MLKNLLQKYRNVLGEILFLRFYPSRIKDVNMFSRILLYLIAITFFYAPIIYNAVTLSMDMVGDVSYSLFLFAILILSRFIWANSQKVQQRFSVIKTKRAFFLRAYLMTEYVVFMWIVYLLYPISCILFPLTMLLTFYGNLFGFHFFSDILMLHTEQFIFYGSIMSYVLFIFFDNYKKVLKGSLPSYLSLYAVLTVISSFVDGLLQLYVPDNIQYHINTFSSILSQIFSLSNQALRIVSSGIVFISAICSLYTTCGLDKKELEQQIESPNSIE